MQKMQKPQRLFFFWMIQLMGKMLTNCITKIWLNIRLPFNLSGHNLFCADKTLSLVSDEALTFHRNAYPDLILVINFTLRIIE